jgi:hypothetical protein
MQNGNLVLKRGEDLIGVTTSIDDHAGAQIDDRAQIYGNRAAKLRADFLRKPLLRGECHVLPAGIEVYIDEGPQLSSTLVCVRPQQQRECIWTTLDAIGDEHSARPLR